MTKMSLLCPCLNLKIPACYKYPMDLSIPKLPKEVTQGCVFTISNFPKRSNAVPTKLSVAHLKLMGIQGAKQMELELTLL